MHLVGLSFWSSARLVPLVWWTCELALIQDHSWLCAEKRELGCERGVRVYVYVHTYVIILACAGNS